jgi:diaminohydroxyphosphoribosylaminopyrimidine deaminase/5-amino-6-(5-phosphoribosylamino)uracil reductase
VDHDQLRAALGLAASVHGAVGPNPRVGCVLVDPAGAVVGRGAHRGAGTPHAEAVALAQAGDRAAGATAYVTLEPCNHHGRTPPCARALIDAGVARVVYAVADPTPAAGGAAALHEAGIPAERLDLPEATDFLRPWLFAVAHGRPFVTAKVASTLDGRVAAADGTSRWITGEPARQWAHRSLRAAVDAIAVGSGTLSADAPRLTVRGVDVVKQPARYVLGEADSPGFVSLPGRDPAAALRRMYDDGVRHLLLEGGPTVISGYLRAGLVDELAWFAAPALLGAGTPAIEGLGIVTLADAQRWWPIEVRRLGDDVLIRSRRG